MSRRHLVPTALAAQALSVHAATIRDWRRRGLAQPKGGSPRRPLWDLADLRRAQLASKPRRVDPSQIDATQDRDHDYNQAEPCPPPA
jgi:hypothetical protein